MRKNFVRAYLDTRHGERKGETARIPSNNKVGLCKAFLSKLLAPEINHEAGMGTGTGP
jgi:hypothetical protein